jgi:hypothetical protein
LTSFTIASYNYLVFKTKHLLLALLSLLIVPLVVTKAFAGGGLIMLSSHPSDTRLHPGEFYTVTAEAYADNSYTTKCQNCSITFLFTNPQPSDKVTNAASTTDSNGKATARMTSDILGDRLVYVVVKMPDGTDYMSSLLVLSYNQSTDTRTPTPITSLGAPSMVYPADGQSLDLEGAYMFKVNPVQGATGYLYGFFQDGNMIYENWRDNKTLGWTEFAVWESNSYHSKFKTGPVKVMIRALVNNQWTEAREITIYLKPRAGGSTPYPTPKVTPKTTVVSSSTSAVPKAFTSGQVIVVSPDGSASAQLKEKVEELENKLNESEQKTEELQKQQSVLEKRIEALTKWIKSLLPFLK